jgi:hypothetical protein
MTKRGVLFGATALLGSVLIGGAANATPYAFASNQITGLIFSTAAGTFTPTSATQTISGSASFGAIAVNNPSVGGPVGTGIDIAAACAGANICTENVFVPLAGLTAGTRSDSNISGFNPGPNPAAGSINLNNVAEGIGNALGTSTANNTGSITFSIVGTGSALSLTLTDTLRLMASTAAGTGESATAQITNTFRVFNAAGTQIASFAPADLNQQVGSANGTPGTANVGPTTITTTLTTPALTAGALYNISLTSSSAESITPGSPVPEPVSLSILGVGLMGLGLARARKRG